MPGRLLLGVDIGTQGSKGALVSETGEIVATHSIEHQLSTPRPGWAEHDADEIWWNGFVGLVHHLLNQTQANPRDVVSIGISALSPDLLPVDNRGRPLRPAILYGIDTRALTEIALMNERLALEPAMRLTAQDVGPKLLWFRTHEPERWQRTHRVVSAHGYIVARLTGRYTIDSGAAQGYRPFYDGSRREWDPLVCDMFEVPVDLLPEVVESTEIVGGVTTPAADETGLAAGTSVIAGITDFFAEVVSTGAGADGDVIVSYGTTMCVLGFSRQPIPDCPGLHVSPHLFGDLPQLYSDVYTVGGGMSTSAALTRWFRDNFGQAERRAEQELGVSAYGVLGLEADAVPPGADGLVVLPYFSGERSPIHDELARGVIFGLTLSHGRGHVYRALLEGVAYGLQHHLDIMREAGVPLRRIVATGGGSRSQLWTQIISDVTGLAQEVIAPSNAALGAAFLAGYAVGIFDHIGNVRQWARPERKVQPRQSIREVYDRYYEVYRRLYEQTKEEMHILARLSAEAPQTPDPLYLMS